MFRATLPLTRRSLSLLKRRTTTAPRLSSAPLADMKKNLSAAAMAGMFVVVAMSGGTRIASAEAGGSSSLFGWLGAPSAKAAASPAENDDDKEDLCFDGKGPGKRVKVDLDPELVESLPVMSLKEVRGANGLNDGGDRLLVSYEGIVYDVTEFVEDHPGGNTLVQTAAGWDLEHFFANYVVHGNSVKAAQWLEPLAVGKLSQEDAMRQRDATTAQVQVDRRRTLLTNARRKIMLVAASLPFWMTIRQIVRWFSWVAPSWAGWIAQTLLPVSVPGVTPGSERLPTDNKHSVAVVGGGIAGCGAAWALTQSGFDVVLLEAREHISGNAKTFDWDFGPFGGDVVKSCVSVTAWPPIFYKNYTCLLEQLGIETVPMPLSWFVNSKVPGYEGAFWQADPTPYPGSLRQVFANDFYRYKLVCGFTKIVTEFYTLKWMPWRWNDLPSMYDSHYGLGLLNPLNIIPLYQVFKSIGGSDAWWNIVFTPQYTASFLVDELRPFPAVFGHQIEAQIPLNPDCTNSWQGATKRSSQDCNITTCVTWKDAGKDIRRTFDLLVQDVDVRTNTRVRSVVVLENGKKRVFDEHDNHVDVDRVVFACPANAITNMYKQHSALAGTILSTPVYADDHHPSTGHMHAIVHSDPKVIPQAFREDVLQRASNYVEVTLLEDGTYNIENQYNFGVQTPGPGIYDLPLDRKPVMLIGHALGDGKTYDPSKIRGTGNHARAHPLYSGWNIAAQLSLRLVQGQDGIYYCSNWTTPANCHDMSLLSGLVVAHAIGADYPFPNNREAKLDFGRLRDLMGI